MIYKLLRYLHAGKLPYKAWTALKSKRDHKRGRYVEVTFHYNTYSQIGSYWRHTLKDLAEYVGGI